MTYLALARKWRPRSFSEVVGQEHVVKALSNALNNQKVHHAILFTGTRGVGKTTLARIFAKSLNCEEGMSATPCQQCATCLAVDEGRFVDLIEVDAASRTKVDDTRELLENVQYAPTSGRYKVYLIDEVHMLSGHSFNALLKTLEEPPEHVKFLFATTDPQKLPITVVSRCLQFSLRAMRAEQIENQMTMILNKESLRFEPSALRLLAQAAQGSMRDGLSLLDQALAQGDGEVLESDVRMMLGSIGQDHVERLIAALGEKNLNQALQISAEMQELAVDYKQALDELLAALYQISLHQLVGKAEGADESLQAAIKQAAAQISIEDVQLYYQIVVHAKQHFAWAPSPRVGFDIALLRLFALEPGTSEPTPSQGDAARTSSTVAAVSSNAASVGSGANNALQSSQQATPVAARPESLSSSAAPMPQNRSQAPEERVHSPVERAQAPAERPQAPANQAKPATDRFDGNNEWGTLIDQSSLQGMARELALNSACERMGDAVIELSLSPKNKHVFNQARVQEIERAVAELLKRPVTLEIELVESDRETPAECLQRLGKEQLDTTKQQMLQEPGLQALLDEFGAQIDESSIEPR